MNGSVQTPPPKIGVIGCGRWGRNIVRTLAELGRLHAIADASTVARETAAAACPGVQAFETVDDIVRSGIDAVVIATPVPTHAEVASRCVEAGLDVFVEKPITLTESDARELVDLAEANGRILMAGHLLLYQPAVRWIRDHLRSGDLGTIFSLHQTRAKLGTARQVENALWSLGVHDVAVMLHLAESPVVESEAFGHCGLQPGVEDDVYLHLLFESGVRASIHNSWLWPENVRRLVVVGSRGMLVYDETTQQVTLHRKRIDENLSNVDDGAEIVFTGHGEPLKQELLHFIECVAERRRPLSDGRSAIEVVRVLESARRRSRARP